LHLKTENMEEIKKQRGGKREGAGRKAVGLSTTAMSLKLDNDLYLALNSNGLNKNRYINDAVRKAMLRDGYVSD
jgi:hypothetical protein